MNIADRIQYLRKNAGISQEELAAKIGVSRQAVSKWESRQSLPDIEKIILLSEYFNVTTDYLLKGTESTCNQSKKKTDARIFSAIGSALNFIGIVVAILIWKEEQSSSSVTVGLILMALGITVFVIGQCIGENRKKSHLLFWAINIWFLILIPISCMFNCIQGISAGHWWAPAPVPQLGNSFKAYGICWLAYVIICSVTDITMLKRIRRSPG